MLRLAPGDRPLCLHVFEVAIIWLIERQLSALGRGVGAAGGAESLRGGEFFGPIAHNLVLYSGASQKWQPAGSIDHLAPWVRCFCRALTG